MKTMFCATVTKTSVGSPLGLRLWAPPVGGSPLLVHLDDHGLFAGKLKAGLQIDFINDMDCQERTVQQIYAYLNEWVGSVTIWASSPSILLGQSSSSSTSCAATRPAAVSYPCKTYSPTPSVMEVSDHEEDEDDSSLSLESLSLQEDYDYYYYYNNSKNCDKPTVMPRHNQQPQPQHRVGPVFDAVVDFFDFTRKD